MNPIILGATALTLGLRHGVDTDHIAAMLDMAGTSVTDGNAPAKKRKLKALLIDLKLPWFYVLGHGLMVSLLGIAALLFGAVIPQWVDKLMERAVGVTLLLLSVYLFYSLYMFARKGHDFKLRSRWMVVFDGVAGLWSWIKRKCLKHEHHQYTFANWDSKGAFTIGLIHGFGAETGTQVLLFATLAGAGSFAAGSYMLSVFTVGTMLSTLLVALCMSTGLRTSRHFKTVVIALGVAAALFSLIVGIYFTLGQGDLLPTW